MARKPGPLRMLAIDECRIGVPEDKRAAGSRSYQRSEPGGRGQAEYQLAPHDGLGRWPANIILTDPIFDGGVEGVVGGGETTSGGTPPRRIAHDDGYGGGWTGNPETDGIGGSSGTYSRFFLIPKADRADREPVLMPDGHDRSTRFSTHPTVKPTDLMRHLVRLVTPTGGTVLDPFLGSGTTALAAEMEGFAWIGIEREAEYVRIAEARLNGTQRGLGLDVGAPTPKTTSRAVPSEDVTPRASYGRKPADNWKGQWSGTPKGEDVA
jgi:hypothetical protein